MRITHFTREITTVRKILDNGFVWVPNKRNLIHSLIPDHDFSNREPQEFGMVSFTENEPRSGDLHSDKFGKYGIIMSPIWVKENKLQKVIYVDKEGPVFEALSILYRSCYQNLKENIGIGKECGINMAYENKAMASILVGILPVGEVWFHLLQLYEYMEPIENSYQQEWRLVNDMPFYGFEKTKKEIIDNVSPPEGWAKIVNLVPVSPKDVQGFICPSDDEEKVYDCLPEEYKFHTIETIQA